MKLLISYFSTRRAALLPPLFLAVFTLVLLLYGLPLYAVGYAAVLCLVPYLTVLCVSIARFRRRHALLNRLLSCVEICSGHLPEPRGAIETDYQALLRGLAQEHEQTVSSIESHYAARIEYYTLWAHQIKTPIAALRLQLSGQDSTDARDMLYELLRIEQYVEMALCYLRLDAQDTDYVFASCALEPLVRACVKKYASQFITKPLRLELLPLPCTALTDEKWLSFVIEQLLSNAVKYTPPGGCIRIGLTGAQTLFIEDTGIGIAPEDLPRIFEQGYTGLNGRMDKRASGIGLYLCRRICDQLGHAIRCTSEPGIGTRMEIDLFRKPLETE